MDFTVRPATEKDFPAMLCLWRKMMDFHAQVEPRFRPLPAPEGEAAWEKHMREDVWGNEEWCILVAESEGEINGQILGMLRDEYPVFEPRRYGYVTDVTVDPSARRRGVGRALFETLKDWLRAQGASHLRLTVAHNNPVSQAFWRAMGCTDYMDQMWYDLATEDE
ncbi:MAG: GNAT family N-acetyltransferase [Anaerolineae bacterium]